MIILALANGLFFKCVNVPHHINIPITSNVIIWLVTHRVVLETRATPDLPVECVLYRPLHSHRYYHMLSPCDGITEMLSPGEELGLFGQATY